MSERTRSPGKRQAKPENATSALQDPESAAQQNPNLQGQPRIQGSQPSGAMNAEARSG